MKHEIEKGIPVPPLGRPASKYPFADLEPGDSVWLNAPAARMAQNLQYLKRKGRRFATRTEKKDTVVGCRVWRLE